ncbi:MAG TPA: Gmad2 immunoglobulin-like domain-containing protein [Chitinophagaceae bacterium]|nr:Gmad2 immunoglobulin-like domain-containing protein [Chitinophagaceae bacterium]
MTINKNILTMKSFLFVSAIMLAGCNSGDQQNKTIVYPDTIDIRDSDSAKAKKEIPAATIYSNDRFKEVTVKKTGDYSFLIQGKAQIFEASFSWVVEDGHEELKKGFEMTDAGAPEWGKFSFTIEVQKKRTNSTLLLILFESSPKDGSRQYELPVLLY